MIVNGGVQFIARERSFLKLFSLMQSRRFKFFYTYSLRSIMLQTSVREKSIPPYYFKKSEIYESFQSNRWEIAIFKEFETTLTNKARPFPCIFGAAGFQLDQLRYSFNDQMPTSDVAPALEHFINHSRDYGQNTSLVIFSKPDPVKDIVCYENQFWSLLSELASLEMSSASNLSVRIRPSLVDAKDIFKIIDECLPKQGAIEVQHDQEGKKHLWHTHDTDETIVILDGKLQFYWEGGKKVCQAGDVIELPRSIKHGSIAFGGNVKYIITFKKVNFS